jgi:hypothetical protein
MSRASVESATIVRTEYMDRSLRLTTRSETLFALPFFLLLLLCYVLPPPQPLQSDVDVSWQFVLTNGFLHGAQFGRDLLFIDKTVEPGKEVILPQRGAGPMWAEIETRPSVLEVLSSAMLRLPPLQLTIDTESRHGVFRIPDELASIGFLLSPLISDPVFLRFTLGG